MIQSQSNICIASSIWFPAIFYVLMIGCAPSQNQSDQLTTENLQQLQVLLKKYKKQKESLIAAEKKKISQQEAFTQPEVTKTQRIKKPSQQRKNKKPQVGERVDGKPHFAKKKQPEQNDESLYSYVTNSLYNWYYGDNGPKEDVDEVIDDVKDAIDDFKDAIDDIEDEAGDLKNDVNDDIDRIHDYVKKHGKNSHQSLHELRGDELRLLLDFIALHKENHQGSQNKPFKPHFQRHSNVVEEMEEEPEKKEGWSATQKGVLVGVITAGVVLLIAAVVFFCVRKYGFPKKFSTKSRFSRGNGDKTLPLRNTGTNLGSIYPPP